MIRLVPDHSARIQRSEKVPFTFDGVALMGCADENLAAALMQAGVLHLRNAPGDGAPRGAFCMMALCQECVVFVDGQSVESCRLTVSPGLVVKSRR
ncbi:(2Fe-2S)-binding protein [Stappia sp.]|jgi:hypothetical protein|uniref:(2Fe-2S)-binding protein n=1 Tax=Stappia sp. TaxID=1870903 RepID=UPI003D14FF88